MKFGKQIQAEQVPGWSRYYLDYKALKKIISSLSEKGPRPTSPAVLRSVRPGDILSSPAISQAPSSDTSVTSADEPPISAVITRDDDRGPNFQAVKTAFFFKLERELEKINAFYLEKEAELKLRLETLLSKRRAAAMRVLPDSLDNVARDHVEWSAVEEGFRLLERDLGKLQQFVEINATGFRKILKKWDKRARSSTKELYLARQVEVQPVFNRQLISELSDTVAACLLDLTDLSVGVKYEGPLADDLILTHQLGIDRNPQMGPFHDLESNLRKAIADADAALLQDLVGYSGSLTQPQARMHITRILWKSVLDAPPDLADLILASTSGSFDFAFIDDINGRTCLHEAAIAGTVRLVDLCLDHGVQKSKVDVYGRSALHYAALNGHAAICRRLIQVGLPPNEIDVDNCTPLIYAILKGSLECVRVVLEEGRVLVSTPTLSSDLMPLSLAAKSGHTDVVTLLLQHGAPSVPNTNGEYPIHLASQEGHAEICRILVHQEGWDVPDKYNEWTPLFHAARFGRVDCLRVLLEAGCRVDTLDEVGNSAAYYAAWHGHRACVSLLLSTSARDVLRRPAYSHKTPSLTDTGTTTGTDPEIDFIPSLYLPPPMMPYRVYGHNYLDQTILAQVSIGHLSTHYANPATDMASAVRLRHPLAGTQYDAQYLHSSPLLKLVMTATPAVTSAPYSVPIPIREEKVVFAFQIPAASANALTLEFSLYPNFGTKTIGRAIALPSLFENVQNSQPFILPILDPRLHVIGEISFEMNVIKPFSGVRLEIGGAIETYWKSLATPAPSATPKVRTPRSPRPGKSLGSAHTSPSNPMAVTTTSHSLTHSSVTGRYIYVTVQVTRDLHPVAYPEWLLPESGYDLGVADLTLQQFKDLARRLGRESLSAHTSNSISEWQTRISTSMSSLADLMTILPTNIGLCLDLAYPAAMIRERYSLRCQVELNDVADSVLRLIYNPPTPLDGQSGRRSVVFTSFSPDMCAALNWKQPNYPVFLSSQCGERSRSPPSATALSIYDVHDRRFASVGSAIEFAKSNNLLGVLIDASLPAQVPSLVQGVKDLGLLVGIFGTAEDLAKFSASDPNLKTIDAALQDGILTYFDHSGRNYS